MNKMVVLHVLCSDQFSGAENVVCQIINLFKSDNDVEMVYSSPDGPIRNILDEKKIRFEPMKEVSIKELRRVITKVKPSIIHAHDMRASFFVSFSAGRIPYISHIHNNNFDSRIFSLKAILYRIAAIRTKHIIWVSKSSFNGYYFHKSLKDKSTILNNIINIKELKKKSIEATKNEAYDLIYIGRLTYPKNPERIIKIISLIKKHIPNVKCAIIGDGDLYNKVRKLITCYRLENNIDILGFQNNPYGMLRNSKIMIMASRWEGLPMCALEAMSLGIPIVSTPVDGLNDIILNDVTGYLSNNDDEFSQLCCILLNNENERKLFSDRSIQRANKLMDIQAYKNEIYGIYKKSINDV